jgi:hypothetical protein
MTFASFHELMEIEAWKVPSRGFSTWTALGTLTAWVGDDGSEDGGTDYFVDSFLLPTSPL